MEKYISFSIKQIKEFFIDRELPSVFVDSVPFLNDSLERLVKKMNQEFDAELLGLVDDKFQQLYGLVKKKAFFHITTGIVLKSVRKIYLAKTNFIIRH